MRKLKLIMPMCGEGSRFVNAGYDKPKPLIDAGGLPLFVRSVECIRVEFDEKIFLTRQQHGLKSDILRWYPDATVIEIDHLPQGTAPHYYTPENTGRMVVSTPLLTLTHG